MEWKGGVFMELEEESIPGDVNYEQGALASKIPLSRKKEGRLSFLCVDSYA